MIPAFNNSERIEPHGAARKLLHQPREYDKRFSGIFNGVKTTYHPHGCIGVPPGLKVEHKTYLNNGQGGYILEYGNMEQLCEWLKKYTPFLAPVDDLRDAENPTYSLVNQILSSAKNSICIGLSSEGIKNSLLDFSHLDQVYYNGKDKVFPNFIPLSKNAPDLIKLL